MKNREKSYTHLFIIVIITALSACTTSAPNVPSSNNAAATSSPSPSSTPSPNSAATVASKNIPTSLVNAGEYSENIYDFAKANNWAKASMRLAALKESAKQLRSDLQGAGAGLGNLDSNIAALDKAIGAKDRQTTMRGANQTTRIVAEMTAPFSPPVPVEVTRLDYEGRELEIWSEAKNAAKLKVTANEIRQTWDALRPKIEARGASVAKRFGDLVTRVEAAKTADEYARLAKPVLDEVDNLEKVFKK